MQAELPLASLEAYMIQSAGRALPTHAILIQINEEIESPL